MARLLQAITTVVGGVGIFVHNKSNKNKARVLEVLKSFNEHINKTEMGDLEKSVSQLSKEPTKNPVFSIFHVVGAGGGQDSRTTGP